MRRDSSREGAEAGMGRKVTTLSPSWLYRSLLNGISGDVQEEGNWKQVAWMKIMDGDQRGVFDRNSLISLGKQASTCFVCFYSSLYLITKGIHFETS